MIVNCGFDLTARKPKDLVSEVEGGFELETASPPPEPSSSEIAGHTPGDDEAAAVRRVDQGERREVEGTFEPGGEGGGPEKGQDETGAPVDDADGDDIDVDDGVEDVEEGDTGGKADPTTDGKPKAKAKEKK